MGQSLTGQEQTWDIAFSTL